MNEFQVIEAIKPQVITNYDEIKTELTEYISKYHGVVVTEDNLGMCREIKKDLLNISHTLDRFRIDKKKELTEPIVAFENQCKELKQLAEDALRPIDKGIKEFQELAKQRKLELARKWAVEIAEDKGLASELIDDILIKDDYGKASITQTAVKKDIEEQIAAIIKREEDKKKRIELFKAVIDSANRRLERKMDLDMFSRVIESTADDSLVIKEINYQADIIFEAEQKAKEVTKEKLREKENPVEPTISEDISAKEESPVKEELVTSAEPKDEYLIKVFDKPDTAPKVLKILADHGYFAQEWF